MFCENLDVIAEPSTSKKVEDKILQNPWYTDYEYLDFTNEKKTKNGESPNLKISSWNLGGIKAWVGKRGLQYLEYEDPDIICFQEVRSSPHTFPSEIEKVSKYPHKLFRLSVTFGEDGIGIMSKTKPLKVSYGFPSEEKDDLRDKRFKKQFKDEARLMVVEYQNFILINTSK